MAELSSSSSELNRAGRREQARQGRRLRKTGAALAAIPAAFGTTAVVLGATAGPVGAVQTWTVTKLADTNDGTCDSDCSLREALDNAADGDTIAFDSSISGGTIHLNATYGQLNITSAVTITGPTGGIVVDADTNSRVFYINLTGAGTDVTISGLTIEGGVTSSDGAGIYDADANLTLDNVDLHDNSADNNGGGVSVGSASSLTVTGSTFHNNTARDDGGAIAVDSVNGAVTVTGSTFTSNQALYGEGSAGYGGAIYVHDAASVSITGSTFTDNFARVDGGAVFVDQGVPQATITDSTFTTNTVARYDGGGAGVNADVVTITRVTFTGNQAGDEGGGLYVSSDSGVVTVTDSHFVGNSSYDDGGGIEIDSADTVTVSGTEFSGNEAGDPSEFASGDGGGIGAHSLNGLTVTGSTFTGNTASSDGGGLWVSDPGLALSISGSTFTGNTAVAYDGGGLAIGQADTVDITTSTIADNRTLGDRDGSDTTQFSTGGGLYFGGIVAVTISNSTISGNQSKGDGGGFVEFAIYHDVTLYNSTVSGNTAGGEGGAAFLSNWYYDQSVTSYTSGLKLVQTTITANVATTTGGVAIDPGNVTPLSVQDGERAHAEAQDAPAHGGTGRQGRNEDDVKPASRKVKAAAAVDDQDTVILDGTILALNSGNDVGVEGTLVAKSSIFGKVTGTTITDQGGNQQNVDPLLGPLQDNGGPTHTHALLPGSPAIDTGPNPLTPFPGSDFDQRGAGYDRVIGGVVDVGAFEVQTLPPEIQPTFTG